MLCKDFSFDGVLSFKKKTFLLYDCQLRIYDDLLLFLKQLLIFFSGKFKIKITIIGNHRLLINPFRGLTSHYNESFLWKCLSKILTVTGNSFKFFVYLIT